MTLLTKSNAASRGFSRHPTCRVSRHANSNISYIDKLFLAITQYKQLAYIPEILNSSDHDEKEQGRDVKQRGWPP